MINYYAILQVDPRADRAVIQSAYRTLMKDLRKHPDFGGDIKEAQLINEAYEHLSDPAKKRVFDNRMRYWQSKNSSSHRIKYVRCEECNTLNRVADGTQNRTGSARCGKCRSGLFTGVSREPSYPDRLQKLIQNLEARKWVRMPHGDSFYDYSVQSTFFLKNFIYIKHIQTLSPQNIRQFIDEFCRTLSRAISPVGHYFVILADKVEYSACILQELKRRAGMLSGWSFGVIVPVDIARETVFLSHINAHRHPQDILCLNEYIFDYSEKNF